MPTPRTHPRTAETTTWSVGRAAGKPAEFPDRQSGGSGGDDDRERSRICHEHGGDAMFRCCEVLLACRGTRQRLQRLRAERGAVTPVGRPRLGLEPIEHDELTNLHRRNLSYRRDVDDLAASLVDRDDLG